MKARLILRATGVFVLLIAVVLAAGAATQTQVSKPVGPPTVTVSAVTLNPSGGTCSGAETDCVRVAWTASVPSGTTVSGWNIVLTVTKANGKVETVNATAATAARQSDVAVFHTVDITSYDAKVTANYSSSVTAGKAGNF